MAATGDPKSIEKRIDALMVGAVDPHVHSGPSIAPRAIDHLELAREASKAGMAAIVTKDHDYAGVMTAALINKHHPELTTKVYSSIVLNNVVGGLNPYGVEHTAAMGGKIVWLPTLAAANHLNWEKESGRSHPASTSKIRPASVVPVTNSDGAVRDDAKEILDVVAKTGMALASGHLHAKETLTVFAEAKKRGVKRMIFTHPEDMVYATLEDVREAVAIGAYVEHSLCMFLDGCKFKHHEASYLKEMIDAAGVEKTIMCSDLGQVGVFHPVDGMRRGIRMCMDLGYSDADIRKMFSTNVAHVLGIESDLPARAAA
ncbi:DUF6282 family protein [Terrarubrum flagellatum]|uniref:DUF6282 family protein n=1 Tax=Terrirubrum flagellatum TaxID=2895980 RepID=UPI0031450EE5